MSEIRRKYDEEFKRRAVQLSYSNERTVKDTADSLGIHVSLLNRWRKRYTPCLLYTSRRLPTLLSSGSQPAE